MCVTCPFFRLKLAKYWLFGCTQSGVSLKRALKKELSIVGKMWEPGNLVPSRFLGQIRKVEARLGKLAKIRKVETN